MLEDIQLTLATVNAEQLMIARANQQRMTSMTGHFHVNITDIQIAQLLDPDITFARPTGLQYPSGEVLARRHEFYVSVRTERQSAMRANAENLV